MGAKIVGFQLLFCMLLVDCDATHENLMKIAEKVNSLRTSWQAEVPAVEEWSIERRLGALRLPEAGDGGLASRQPPPRGPLHPGTPPPEDFDARQVWPDCPSIPLIRDQGNCGSCWALAPASVLSDRYCIQRKGAFTSLLSDEQLLACCGSLCGFGCQGGYPELAWHFVSRNGLVSGGLFNSTQGCQPYSIPPCGHTAAAATGPSLPQCKELPIAATPLCREGCTNPIYQNKFHNDTHLRNKFTVYHIPSEVETIQREIMRNGPVMAVFMVYSDFAVYKSGVYRQVTGEQLGGHAVRLLGWGGGTAAAAAGGGTAAAAAGGGTAAAAAGGGTAAAAAGGGTAAAAAGGGTAAAAAGGGTAAAAAGGGTAAAAAGGGTAAAAAGGTPYWLVANSWNSDWGEAGTFKILRGSDECGIESSVSAPLLH